MPQNEVTTLPERGSRVSVYDRGTPQQFSLAELERLALAFAKSGLFGVRNVEQALSLMLISQAEGRHPALAAQDYSIIQGRPSKNAAAMQRDFMAAGGRIEWHELSDDVACATFSHPQGGTVRILWDQARVKQAGLAGREMHAKYPRQMLRARCVSEGVKTVFPLATSGFFTPEEVRDMPAMALPDAPHDTAAALDQFAAVTGDAEPFPPRDILADAREMAEHGAERFTSFWQSLSKPERDSIRQHLGEFERAARRADSPFDLPPLAPPEQPQADPLTSQPVAGPASEASPPDAGQPFAQGDVFAELDHEARAATKEGPVGLEAWKKTLRKSDRDLMRPHFAEYERLAKEEDASRGLAL